MKILTLLEKIVVGAVILILLALVFGASVATAMPEQGSSPEDIQAEEPEPNTYWVIFVRQMDAQLLRFAYVDEEGCRATEQKAIEEPTIVESSGCVRVALKLKASPTFKEETR